VPVPPAPAAPAPVPLHAAELASRRSKCKRAADRAPEVACSICLNHGFEDAWSVGLCGHTFCEVCIFQRLAANGGICPTCRSIVTVAEIVPNFFAPKRARAAPLEAEEGAILSMPTEVVW
jgi:hypothetical protein